MPPCCALLSHPLAHIAPPHIRQTCCLPTMSTSRSVLAAKTLFDAINTMINFDAKLNNVISFDTTETKIVAEDPQLGQLRLPTIGLRIPSPCEIQHVLRICWWDDARSPCLWWWCNNVITASLSQLRQARGWGTTPLAAQARTWAEETNAAGPRLSTWPFLTPAPPKVRNHAATLARRKRLLTSTHELLLWLAGLRWIQTRKMKIYNGPNRQ